MKKLILHSILSLSAAFILSCGLVAQEKTEITIQVKKDGKVVQDTTYQFDDAAEAKHAIKMMEVLSGDGEHMMEYNYTMAHKHGDHSKTMVFISEDGENTTIKEMQGDTLVWITEEEHDGECIKKKHVKVIVSGNEHGTWHVDEEGLVEVEEEVYVLSGDDAEIELELEKILEEHGGDEENVKVIVIKKKYKKQ